ncbi:MAG: hypothetical protein VXY99_10270 [Pseudomonadota bacterium]|nr:hypothetical protein [Pseudomonadota bacterium]
MKFNIINHGSLIGFTPVDDTAQAWWDKNIQECHQMGDQYLVEHRFAYDIIDEIQAASDKQQAASRGQGGPTGDKQG